MRRRSGGQCSRAYPLDIRVKDPLIDPIVGIIRGPYCVYFLKRCTLTSRTTSICTCVEYCSWMTHISSRIICTELTPGELYAIAFALSLLTTYLEQGTTPTSYDKKQSRWSLVFQANNKLSDSCAYYYLGNADYLTHFAAIRVTNAGA